MITAAASELEQAGITEAPGIVLADAGYRNGPHIDALVSRGTQVLVRPDADTRKAPSRLRQGGLYDFMRAVLARPDGQALYRQRQAIIEPVFAHTKTADAPTASSAAAWRPAGPNGGCWPLPTTSSSSGATA